MTWLIDLGNTRLKIARRLADGGLSPPLALSHGEPGFVDALASLLASTNDTEVLLASVASAEVRDQVIARIGAAGAVVRQLRSQAQLGEVRNGYANPQQLGVDRLLAMVAAHARGLSPCVIVSVGSALTLDVLAGSGFHLGGLIAPTPEHARAALAVRFPVLPEHGGEVTALARDTASAVASGTTWMVTAMIEAAWAEASNAFDESTTLLLTGGGAEALLPHLPEAAQHLPHLVLEGMNVVATQTHEVQH